MVVKNITISILPLANTYTGANFSNPPTEEQRLTMITCAQFIVDMFPMIGLQEIQLAFSMAAANKFPQLNLETYYGKFSVQFLGKVLHAYLTKRKEVIANYETEVTKIEAQKDESEELEKNEKAKTHVIESYNALLAKFIESGDIDMLNEEVYPYWGKILVQEGLINFDHETKQGIVEEAKKLAGSDIHKELQDEMRPAVRRSLQTVLTDIFELKENATFELKWRNKYAKLIVIKAIINQ